MEHEVASLLRIDYGPESKMPSHISCKYQQRGRVMESGQHMTRKLCGVILLYLVFTTFLIVGGLKANSLAVLTDAAHLVTDIVAFSVSLFALRVSRWEATLDHSFGFDGLEVLGALLSVQLVWLVSGFLIYEAFERLLCGSANVNGKFMFAVSAIGSFIHLMMLTWLEHDHEKRELCGEETKILSISIEGGYLHVTEDMLQSIGVMIAGGIIWAKPEWFVIDLVCTLVYSVPILSSTLSILRNICGILMGRTPSDIDVVRLEDGLRCIKGVRDIHDLHIWAITVGKVVLSCHVPAEPGADPGEMLNKIRDYCEREYRICDVTIQIE